MPLVASIREDVDASELTFQFGNGSVALDLVATVGERRRRRFERLRTPTDLGRWLRDAGLVGRSRPTSDHLADARGLRSAIFDLVEARRMRKPPPTGAQRAINLAASVDSATPRLTRTWELALEMHSRDPVRGALALIARDAIEVLAEVDPSRIRICEGSDCSRLFVDRSRPGRRRWCESAAGCGNRAKLAAYRRRKRSS